MEEGIEVNVLVIQTFLITLFKSVIDSTAKSRTRKLGVEVLDR
jgi:hypothetical protein